jgi:uncharacterized protein (DUF1501 family)
MQNRRAFISQSLGVAVLGGSLPLALVRAVAAQPLPSLGSNVDPRNVLVVIQMTGGNDGLNTIVPYSDDAYHRVRPVIRIDETNVLKLNDRIGLNPAMAPLLELFKDGRVAIVQGVGYPNPNRSHFESTQIWETASPDRPMTNGWLGRYLDRISARRESERTSARSAPPAIDFTAIALGDQVPTALLSQSVDVPAVGGLNSFVYAGGSDAASKRSAGVLFDGARPGQSPYLGLIEETARAAFYGGDILRGRTAGYKPMAAYPKDSLSNQLALAAQIIGSNLGTRIIFVSIGSFDTHSDQVGQQNRLLGYLAGGLSAFYKDLAAHGNADRVLAMTFSEFGRRVQQNASNGTDHGTAMPLFVLGGRVKGGVYGEHPSLEDLDNGDLKYHIDFRSVYSTVLRDWLGRNPSDVIAGSFDTLPFV